MEGWSQADRDEYNDLIAEIVGPLQDEVDWAKLKQSRAVTRSIEIVERNRKKN